MPPEHPGLGLAHQLLSLNIHRQAVPASSRSNAFFKGGPGVARDLGLQKPNAIRAFR